MTLAEELRASFQALLASRNLEIRESGGRVMPVEPVCWEARGREEKPLLRLGAENCHLTRGVLSINDHSAERVALSVERFGKSQPQRLDLVRVEFQRSAKEILREGFCEQSRPILAAQFPDETVEKASIAADLRHSPSRIYARGISRKRVIRCAFSGGATRRNPRCDRKQLDVRVVVAAAGAAIESRAQQKCGHGIVLPFDGIAVKFVGAQGVGS